MGFLDKAKDLAGEIKEKADSALDAAGDHVPAGVKDAVHKVTDIIPGTHHEAETPATEAAAPESTPS